MCDFNITVSYVKYGLGGKYGSSELRSITHSFVLTQDGTFCKYY